MSSIFIAFLRIFLSFLSCFSICRYCLPYLYFNSFVFILLLAALGFNGAAKGGCYIYGEGVSRVEEGCWDGAVRVKEGERGVLGVGKVLKR